MTHKSYFLMAQEELASGVVDEALHAKSLAIAGGDEVKAKAIYTQLRAEEISSEKTLSGIATKAQAIGTNTNKAIASTFRVFLFVAPAVLVASCAIASHKSHQTRLRIIQEIKQDLQPWLGESEVASLSTGTELRSAIQQARRLMRIADESLPEHEKTNVPSDIKMQEVRLIVQERQLDWAENHCRQRWFYAGSGHCDGLRQ